MPVAVNGGVRINFETVGPDDGDLVILVAGLGQQIGDVEFPEEHAALFAAAGFRVALVDNRDAGLSTSFDAFGRPALEPLFAAAFAGEPIPLPYSFVDMADDIIAVADALNAREVHLVGASLGGWLVRWAALRHHDRVRSLAIVMSGSGADPSDDAPQLEMEGFDELFKIAGRRSRDEHIAFMVEQWRRDWGSFEFNEPWVREHVAQSFDRTYRPDGVYRQLIAGFGSAGLWHAQRSIAAPTLVIHGTEDQVFPVEHGEATAAQIPGAAMWRVSGMGHAMAPELWAEMVERIGKVASR